MISIFVRTIIIYILLSFFLKLMGKRQIGELEVGELVSTLLISEIAAIPIDDPDLPLLNAIIPTVFILSAEVILSSLKNQIPALKKIIEGKPVYIIYKGKLRQRALHENRISINELLSELRGLGFGDLSDVEYAVLEPNGKLSAIAKAESQPITPRTKDAPDYSGIAHTLVIDREIITDNLYALGFDLSWLERALTVRSLTLDDVFLMTVDDIGTVRIIEREDRNA